MCVFGFCLLRFLVLTVVASQKLVLAVQKMLRLPADMRAEGALAALRLISEVSTQAWLIEKHNCRIHTLVPCFQISVFISACSAVMG